jgi:hypothetical protein
MIEINTIRVYNNGDTSVGILPSSHEISGPFFFESEEELKEFEKEIVNAFELVMDPVRIEYQQ